MNMLNKKYPISLLYQQVLNSFSSFGSDKTLKNHRSILNTNDTSVSIEIRDNNYNRGGIKGPECLPPYNLIVITHEYLSFLWCITYYLLSLYENVRKQVENNHSWNGDIIQNKQHCIAEKILGWAMNLKDQYIAWDNNLPKPNASENFVTAVDKVFLDAVSWILFHEYSHIIQGLNNGNINISQNDLENEADNKAIEMMICDNNDVKYKFLTGVGLIIAYISMFFILTDPIYIKQDEHDDLDIRLFSLFTKLNINDKSKELSLKLLACFGLEMFCNKWNIQKPKQINLKNADKLLESYKECFEKFKLQ